MSFKIFKNSKAARRNESNILLNLQAIDKQIKPCYLWDAFNANLNEVQSYLEALRSLGFISLILTAFSISDTIFVTHHSNLMNYLTSFSPDNVDVVDVSRNKTGPSILSSKEKNEILRPILDSLSAFLSNLCVSIDLSRCNVTTLFGILLGYPVLYWYKAESPDAEFTCLSMVPLTVYCVRPCERARAHSNHNTVSKDLFSFSIPEEVSKQTILVVKNWFSHLTHQCKQNGFKSLKMSHHTVSVPCVTM